MHAKDTPFHFLIHEISNISGIVRPPAARRSQFKTQGLTLNHRLHIQRDGKLFNHELCRYDNRTTIEV
jgi:hypothetical protein